MSGSLRSFWVPVGVVLAAVVGVAALAVQGQVDARRDLEERFAAQARISVVLFQAHIGDVFARQAVAAERHLTGAVLTPEDVEEAAAGLLADFAIVVDDDGRVIGTHPHSDMFLGLDITGGDEYLDATVEDGERTVSGIVEVPGFDPFVSFNLSFDTPTGRRAYILGFEPQTTLPSTFLTDVATVGENVAYLVDDAGQVVASSNRASGSLADVDPELASVFGDLATEPAGDAGSEHQYTSAHVDDAPWTLVLQAPNEELYGPLRNVRRATSVVLAALAVGTIWILGLLVVARSRAGRLASMATTDPLTGTGNRRTLDAWAQHVDPTTPIAALVVDLDRFKEINDSRGHPIGDEVLLTIGRRLRLAVRAGDEVVRWGGDEFALVLQNADNVIAEESAERVRASVEEPITTSVGPMHVSASVGVAVGRAGTLARTLGRADVALYEAKRAGRNRAVLAGPEVEATTLNS